MKNLCTVSDSSFLIKGLAMYDSIQESSEDFMLHYLLIDAQINTSNIDKHQANVKFYNINDLLSENEELQKIKEDNYDYFCWILSAYFTNYLINKYDFDSVTYIDSDIYFYQNINILFEQFGSKDIGVFRHRMFPLGMYRPEGLLNVGVVYFKNTAVGKEALGWWVDAVINKKYPGLATCGDQKYLEFFMYAYPNNIQLDGDAGHSAPWLWQIYNIGDFYLDGTIKWENKKQLLVFNHFSQFSADFEKDSYIGSTNHHIYTPLKMYSENLILKNIHDDYFEHLKSTKEKYNL